MSRSLSSARSAFEQANIALEDVLLKEMGVDDVTCRHDIGQMTNVSSGVRESIGHLGLLKQHITHLRQNMDECGFQDLHKELGISPWVIAHALAPLGVSTGKDLATVASVLESEGFRGMLRLFDETASELVAKMEDLLKASENLAPLEPSGQITEELEMNKPRSLRPAFAQAYGIFGRFQQLFLASSVVSTELWYRWSKVGSFVTGPQKTAEVA